MSTALKTAANAIVEAETKFIQVAPKHISYKKEQTFAMQILKSNSYLTSVAEKAPASLAAAIVNVASIGLSLNPAEKLAYLIPRNIKDGNRWVSRIYLEPSYMGLCKLATDSGSIDWVQARCVYANDTFIDNGVGDKPTHTYNAFGERGEFVGVYCVAKTNGGDYLTTTMTKDKVHDIRSRSESWKKKPNSGVWQTDFEEQAKKTVIRNGSKTWPKTNIHFASAVHLSNENMGFEPFEQTTPQAPRCSQEQKEYFDGLIERGAAMEMHLLKRSLCKDDSQTSVWVDLHHSFPKGQKGKYQSIVLELQKKGEQIYADCLQSITDAIQSSDDLAIKEIIEGESQEFMDAIKDDLPSDMVSVFMQISGGSHD